MGYEIINLIDFPINKSLLKFLMSAILFIIYLRLAVLW